MKKTQENYLLQNEDKLVTFTDQYASCGAGHVPYKRPVNEYLKYGVVVLDKPPNPSSHEVVSWVKEILNCEKTGHAGTLDPSVTGVLPICLNKATALAKSQQNKGKTYVCEIEFEKECTKEVFEKACKRLTGHLFQRPPEKCAVKRELRLRWIYEIKLIEFESKRALFAVKCEAGTYIRTLCTHIGFSTGIPSSMKELRRIKSGSIEESCCVTLFDLKDAQYYYEATGNDEYLRKVILPVEYLLRDYPRIILKDTAVNAICYGGQLTIKGVYKYDSTISTNAEVVLITAKGEVIAIANSLLDSSQFQSTINGPITKTKRVIMEKDLYPRVWGIMHSYEVFSNEGTNLLEKK